jgi:hypothetical protein
MRETIVLDDGRLVLDNNRSERALRGSIAIGRKAWLFAGSAVELPDHGKVIALARLGGIHHRYVSRAT